jgi:hypothetical protein
MDRSAGVPARSSRNPGNTASVGFGERAAGQDVPRSVM